MPKSTTAYRSVRKSHFTQISNDLLNDKTLSLEAKGLLSIFLSNNDKWDLHMSEIIKRSKNGRDAHYTALKKLIKAGYIARLEFKQMNNYQFLQLEYIFSDNKEDVINGIKDAQKFASENEQIIILTYKDIESHKVESSIEDIEKKPFTENPDTEENSEISPFTENPDTDNPNTEKPNTESQYNNNTNNNNTNSNNTNSNNTNDMNDMNDREQEVDQEHSNHSSHFLNNHDKESLKELEMQEFPHLIKMYLHNFNYEEVKSIKSVILKAKKSFNNKYDTIYMLEEIDEELLTVLKRFKGYLVKKQEKVTNMEGYLMRSIIAELEEMHSTIKRRENVENNPLYQLLREGEM
ncbi:nuclease [Mammaliicoccus sciuri]|nr:nuclease [Mammaliicoccus sciuri]MCE4981242.1 nuclease [Mammaliicoccus sciuri]MCE5086176.1 nuclease [Mammaliicoccus sciuri]HDF4307652.1 nuclease [Staphylococcus aureus]HDF4308263.1 nuclease [Staphylococcus aureus]